MMRGDLWPPKRTDVRPGGQWHSRWGMLAWAWPQGGGTVRGVGGGGGGQGSPFDGPPGSVSHPWVPRCRRHRDGRGPEPLPGGAD